MTSMGCKEIKETHCWNSCFKVQGQVYHLIGSLCPLPNETAKFAQIYFLGDTEAQSHVRQGIVPGLKLEIIQGLQTCNEILCFSIDDAQSLSTCLLGDARLN
jgi:hypothetical protein